MPRWVYVLSCSLLAIEVVAADERRWSAAEWLNASTSERVELADDGRSITLARGRLYEDDGPAAGYSYQSNEEKLGPGIQIKKALLVADPRARGATLLVGGGEKLQFIVNGQPRSLEPLDKAGQYWSQYALPLDALRQGANEFVISGGGKVWIARSDEFALGSLDRSQASNRSAKSRDDGQSWSFDQLGTKDDLDGEYYVRLFLDQYQPQGRSTLNVVDLGNLAAAPIGPPLKSLGKVSVQLDADSTDSSQLKVLLRTGPSPLLDSPEWSAWQTLGATGGTLDKPRGRFAQLAIEWSSVDPRATPELRGVTLSAQVEPATNWTQRLSITQRRNPTIVRSSVPFEYEPFDQLKLRQLRERFRLDDVVAGAERELDLICRLAVWASQQWDQGHLSKVYPAWDALEILKPHDDGRPIGGFCQQYNLVLLQACESFGLVGRAVSIGPGALGKGIRGGHEVVEIWSNELGKWIYVDGNTAWYLRDRATQTPLSLRELRARQLAALQSQSVEEPELVKLATTKYEWTDLAHWPPFVELRMIPRSNFLERRAPLPLHQGMRGWFWTGHQVWSDAQAPAARLYGERVTLANNWDWTLNQAQLYVWADESAPQLHVAADTHTPHFDSFLSRLDNQSPLKSPATFVWRLHPGENALDVWPRNRASRDGIASRWVINYAP